MNLLNFLIYWSTRVYEWFATLYTRGREVALYAFSWILVESAKVLLAAIQWASTRVSQALNTAWSWILDRYHMALAAGGELFAEAHARIDAIVGWVNARVQWVVDRAAAIVNGISDWVADRLNEIRALIDTAKAIARESATGLVNTLQTLIFSKLTELWSDVIALKNSLLSPDSSGQPALLTFAANPLGFIMAFVWSVFQDLLCFGLAYGLGTVKYDLPDLPDWNSKGAVGVIDTGSLLPPGAGGLAPPLESISVSGYTFTKSHPGIDLGLDNGDSVHAMHAGTVLVADFSNVGYGFNVVVSGGDWWSRYAHLQALAVRVGDKVVAGQRVGLGDSTGNSTGPHLHLELKFKGNFIDPLTVL